MVLSGDVTISGHYPTEADVNVPVEDEPIDKSPASFPVVPPSSQEAEVTTTHVPGNGSDGNPSNPDINMSPPESSRCFFSSRHTRVVTGAGTPN